MGRWGDARLLRLMAIGWVAVTLASCGEAPPPGEETKPPVPAAPGFQVPVHYHHLDNGLKVVLSPDTTAPTVTVAVYYHIGFRLEPPGRTGFAHLFEHMMFQGSAHLGKLGYARLVNRNGGVFNGSSRFDFTNYFAIVPAHMLETLIWAEADRMRGLVVNEENLVNQKAVVKNEVRVNVLNRPYGGFPWLDMPQHANQNWHNAHNFYGEMDDLDAASLDEVTAFFARYYTPDNAVVTVVGDFHPDQTLDWIQGYFGGIPRGTGGGDRPDLNEPRQTEERFALRHDPMAAQPAFAMSYHLPERWSPEWYAMGLLDQLLLQGRDSRLHQALVQQRGMTAEVSGGINLLGNQFNYQGPMLWTASFIHDPGLDRDEILEAIDEVIEAVRTDPVAADELERARIKWRSRFYDTVGERFGYGRADILSSLALFDDDPTRVNQLEAEMMAVTPGLILATAREFLRPGNRTSLVLTAGATSSPSPEAHGE